MFKIVTDSAANFTQEEATNLGITVLPLSIIFGTREYRDGVDISYDEFYHLLETSPDHPQTSQINPSAFETLFAQAKEKNESLFVITLSSALSGTYNSALIAKENGKYDNVCIYDSLGATVMEKMLVLTALQNADKSEKDLISLLNDVRARMKLYAVVDTLEYLHKGGRLRKSVAFVGKIIDLKPVITVSEKGSVEMCGKAIGSKRAIRTIRQLVLEDTIDPAYPVFYIYSKTKDKCQNLAESIHPDHAEYIKNASNLCSVIGVHIGPGAAGICYIAKK